MSESSPSFDRKAHWEKVYQTKGPETVSWYQPRPALSLDLIGRVGLPPTAALIDVGGGASRLVDSLLEMGFGNLTVLDIAESALRAAQSRLGQRAAGVRWLTADITHADLPADSYDLWHDRAVFHFLTDPQDRAEYAAALKRALRPGGTLLIASFAPDGPTQCSALDVVRYDCESVMVALGGGFELIDSVPETHQTPSGGVQHFMY